VDLAYRSNPAEPVSIQGLERERKKERKKDRERKILQHLTKKNMYGHLVLGTCHRSFHPSTHPFFHRRSKQASKQASK